MAPEHTFPTSNQQISFNRWKRTFQSVWETVVSLFVLLLLFSLLFLGISAAKQESVQHYGSQNNPVGDYYTQEIDSLDLAVKSMLSNVDAIDQSSMQDRFKLARRHYKHAEFLVDYFFRESALKINGPNLPEAHPRQPEQPVYATGFQVLEEALYADVYSKNTVKNELYNLLYAINKLRTTPVKPALHDAVIFHALKLNLYRLITKGITGFDSPVALNSIPEATETLISSQIVFSAIADDPSIDKLLSEAIAYTHQHTDFNTFDRAAFITQYLNPLCSALHSYQLTHHIPFNQHPETAIRSDVPTLFSPGAFDPYYFAPSDALPMHTPILALGEQLFKDVRLSGDGTRSCITCHEPSKGFSDGMRTNHSLDGSHPLARNTPSLFYAGYQNVQFLDSRLPFLEDQAHAVITNEEEMDGHMQQVAEQLVSDKTYKGQFKKVFGTSKIDGRMVQLALAAYVRSLAPFDSRFDRYMRGNNAALTNDEVQGFNLFAGKAKCATCHFIPLFNGSLPPFFDKTESEVLGVPAEKSTQPAMDEDPGKYSTYRMPHQLYSFKTGSLRNTEFTGPYMHNGVFTTLEEVIDFYDKGGGEQYGFDLPNQTLPGDELNLTELEKKQLIAFLKALSDESVAGQIRNQSQLPSGN